MLSLVLSLGLLLQTSSVPYSVAHRGCHIKNYVPENSTAGVKMAKRYGFRAIECDAHYTKDSVLIIMHDATINRTCRLREGYAKIPGQVKYADITFEELRTKYVLASDKKSMRTPVPSFREELQECKRYGIIPVIHSDVVEAFRMAYEILGDNFVAFDGKYEPLVEARRISPGCLVLWDPGWHTAQEAIQALKAIGGRCGISSMKCELLTEEYIHQLTAAGYEVQESIWKSPLEVQGIADGCTYVLSDFSLFADSRNPAQVRTVTDKTLEKGDCVEFTFPKTRYSSVDLTLKISGSVEVTVGGKHSYTFEGTSLTRKGGWRFYNEGPSIRITAGEKTVIDTLEVKEYKY